MSLQTGTRLGPYEIVGTIGAGGMGEVYKARDTRLDRTVALKVIGAALAGTPELRERFEREARTISQLNHPAICTLHDVGHAGDTSYIVFEYLEGEPLTSRIARGAMAPQEALPMAVAICEALDAAHRQGIVHRDLKPGNIMLLKRGTPKLLDFGLAKLAQPSGTGAVAVTAAPTATSPLTARGSIIGTFQYMSPEQLEGGGADARSDIWAFGCVLYEMLTGRRAFEGKSQASVISAILSSEPPPITALQPLAPAALDHTVRTCLAKNPDDRFQHVRDLMLQLKWIVGAGSQAGVPAAIVGTRRRRATVRMVGAVTAAILATAVLMYAVLKPADSGTPDILRAAISLPRGIRYSPTVTTNLAVSPDGSRLAFLGFLKDNPQLYMRDNRSGEIRPLAGTENAIMPFFSPDGEWLAFLGGGKLKKVAVRGGSPIPIADIPPTPFGATWAPDGTIIFSQSGAGPLMRISADGGSSAPATTLAKGETSHRWPSMTPDGKTLLFTAGTGGSWSDAHIVAQRLDGSSRAVVVQGGASPRYAPSGHLVYARGAALYAIAFDPGRLATTGAPQQVLEGLIFTGTDGRAQYGFSQNGSLVYAAGIETAPNRTLVWVTRDGKVEPLPLPERGFEHPRLSPNEHYIALTIRGEGDTDIWLYDITRATLSRFTVETGEDESAVWTPDSLYLTFSSSRTGKPRQTLTRPIDGSRPEEELFSVPRHQHLGGWTPDGQTLVSEEVDESWTIYTSRRGGTGAPLFISPFQEQGVTLSVDGKWIAYSSNESGVTQVFVRAFPGPGATLQVSTDGGTEPRWSRAGNELFYRNGDKMMVVSFQTTPQFLPSTPKPLFTLKMARMGWPQANYDVSRDGKRFLVVQGEEDQLPTELQVITNWFQTLPPKR